MNDENIKEAVHYLLLCKEKPIFMIFLYFKKLQVIEQFFSMEIQNNSDEYTIKIVKILFTSSSSFLQRYTQLSLLSILFKTFYLVTYMCLK